MQGKDPRHDKLAMRLSIIDQPTIGWGNIIVTRIIRRIWRIRTNASA